MARIRSVHPGLWTDDDFVSLSLYARLFLIGLWNEADDYGLFEWKPLRLKMRLAPADAIDVAAIMDELALCGFVVRIERAGKPFGVVKNFRKFQRPKNPSAPIVPVDDEIRAIISLAEDGSPTPVLPQSYPSPGGIPPQMEDVGEKKEGSDSLRSSDAPRVSADAEAAAPSPEKPIVEILFGSCLRYLVSNGIVDKQARSVIGKWRRDYGDGEVAAAIGEAQKDAASEPVPLVTAILQRRREARARAGPGRAVPYSNAALARSLLQDIDHEHDSADPGRNGAALHRAEGHRKPGASPFVPAGHLRLAGPDAPDD